MGIFGKQRRNASTTFLGALRRDIRGNTIALMAAALFPLLGLVGGGVDLARLYMTKTRLQHACDAGALAGRKAMGGGIWSQDSYKPRDIANQFFTGNFGTGSYGSKNLSSSIYSESNGKVTGSVSVQLPMIVMQVFGIGDQTIAVTCDAEMRLPNTDVMFVLDTTGSMGYPAPGGGGTKLDVLQSAVKCFYESVARLNTTENCPNGNSNGGTSPDIQVRFGFVPFATNVNVGRLLPSNWFADNWSYQSRERATLYGTPVNYNGDSNYSSWSSWTNTTRSSTAVLGSCSALIATADSVTTNGDPYWPDVNSQTATVAGTNWPTKWTGDAPYLEKDYQVVKSGTTCQEQVRQRTFDKNYDWQYAPLAATPGARPFPAWTYKLTSLDIRGLKSGTGWNTGFALPIGDNYTDKWINWDGCIEERATVKQTSYQPIPSNAWDLDIDTKPDSRPATQWGPVLPDVLHMRHSSGYSRSGGGAYRFRGSDGNMTTDNMTTFTQAYDDDKNYACAVPAKKMAVWTDPTTFENYVDSLRSGGNTYHDIGLLWGARLLSPTGLFASENATTPRGGDIQRNLIFMTDGDACTNSLNYQAYGLAWYDRRTISATADPGTGQSCSHDGSPSELTRQIDARTTALCTAIKNKNIALWVIYFPDAGAVYPTVETRLQNCADSGRYYAARTSNDLKQAFADIAAQISQLRLTN